MDPEWAERVSRLGDRIDTENATQDDLEEYVATKIYLHNYEDFTDYDLWTIFREEFKNFTVNNFRQLRIGTRAKLRAHLLRRGVYVGKHNTKRHISDVLVSVLQEEEQHVWTNDELADTLVELKLMITVSLRSRLNSTLTGLATTSSRLCSPSLSSRHNTPSDTIPSDTTPSNATPSATPSSSLRQASANPFTRVSAPAAIEQSAYETAPAAITQLVYKEIATVAKVYTDGQKYDGSTSFDYKLTIFYNICKRSGLSRKAYAIVFLTMLKGLAEKHYYSSNLADRSFEYTCAHMRNFFEGPEYYRKNLTEWNSISL
jgi:hypothetical protein